MDEAIERYLRMLRVERHASAHTLRAYRTDLLDLQKFLRDRRGRAVALGKVETDDLRAYVAAKLRDSKRTTIARHVAAIRGFFRFLANEKTIRRDPAAALAAPKAETRLPDFLPIDETEKVLGALPEG